VILFGEHAVVHGVTAIAAALSDLRIVAQAVSSVSNYTVACYNAANAYQLPSSLTFPKIAF
jgi:mevalonate kinase